VANWFFSKPTVAMTNSSGDGRVGGPVLVPVSAHGSASDRNCALASTICLRWRTGRRCCGPGKVLEHFEKLAPVFVRARDLLAVNPAAPFGAQLLKLRVERLSVGAHAGIAETAVFGGVVGPWFSIWFRSGMLGGLL